MPFSRFSLGPQSNQQIISITGGAVPAIYFQDQRVTMEQLGPLLEAAKRKDQSIIIKADRSVSYEIVAEVTNAALQVEATRERLQAMAESLGLDMDAFNSCFSANTYETEIQADFDLGQQMGVSGTPTVFVNGRRVGQANSVASYPEIAEAVNAIAAPQ